MKRTYFNDLSLELKERILVEFATPLLSIEYYDHRIDLYALNALFVERYENIATGKVEKIVQAEYTDLDKFLSQIMIGRSLAFY